MRWTEGYLRMFAKGWLEARIRDRAAIMSRMMILGAVCALGAATACGDPTGVATVVVTPAVATLHSIGATLQLVAEARRSGNAVMGARAFVWTSSDTTKVTVSAIGLVTAVAAGSATITATTGGVSGAAEVAVAPVVAHVVVVPASLTLSTLRPAYQLVAEARDSNSTLLTGWPFVWTSGDTTVVRVSSTGIVTFVAVGSATITATTGGVSGSTVVTVVNSVSSVMVAPARIALFAAGASRQLTTEVRDSGGNLFPDHPVTWSSSDTAVVRISASGLATAVAWGTGTVTATAGGVTGSTAVSVREPEARLPIRLSAGSLHTCGLTADGAAFCWGQNASGQLGDGTVTGRASPVAVGGGLTFVAIGAGPDHTCGLIAGGMAYCWGRNGSGQLGDGTVTNRASPVAVAGGLTFVAIGTGDSHSCGLTVGGASYCWGSNSYAQLGVGTTGGSSPVPTLVSGGLPFVAISVGGKHNCGLVTGGTAYCWGSNRAGILGDGTAGDRASPVAVAGGVTFAAISAGTFRTCGVSTAGEAYCWGDNTNGELGVGMDGGNRLVPALVAGGLAFVAISTGVDHSCGLTEGGAGWCWGLNGYGQLGIGVLFGRRSSPVAVVGDLRFSAVVAGMWHSCGLTVGGAAYCWGVNYGGEVGDGTYSASRSSPVPVAGGILFGVNSVLARKD